MSSFSISTYELDGVLVMDMKGRMDSLGDASGLLRQTVRHALAAESRLFVFNLEDVGYIGSNGLGALVEAYTEIRNQQGDVGLANPLGRSLDLMAITRLVCLFKVFPAVRQAIAYYASKGFIPDQPGCRENV
jgi:anti-sigma B factor antagonist